MKRRLLVFGVLGAGLLGDCRIFPRSGSIDLSGTSWSGSAEDARGEVLLTWRLLTQTGSNLDVPDGAAVTGSMTVMDPRTGGSAPGSVTGKLYDNSFSFRMTLNPGACPTVSMGGQAWVDFTIHGTYFADAGANSCGPPVPTTGLCSCFPPLISRGNFMLTRQ